MNKEKIGEKLKAYRGSRTQREVAKAVGISPSAYAMYERGKRVPKDAIKVRLAAYYNKSISTIFYAED